MSQYWWRARCYRLSSGWWQSKIVFSYCKLKNTIKKLFLFGYCCFGSVLRSWLCEVTGRFLMYINRVRMSFSILGSRGPIACSYMAQKCQKCFLWIMLLLHKWTKTAARSVLVQSHDNQFLLISCHPGKPPKASILACAFCKDDTLVYLSHIKVVFFCCYCLNVPEYMLLSAEF